MPGDRRAHRGSRRPGRRGRRQAGAGRGHCGLAQAVEYYEIARYGILIAWADELGRDDIVRLLTTNLNEEKAADKKLSTVALRKGVNRKAAS